MLDEVKTRSCEGVVVDGSVTCMYVVGHDDKLRRTMPRLPYQHDANMVMSIVACTIHKMPSQYNSRSYDGRLSQKPCKVTNVNNLQIQNAFCSN